MKRIGILTSGGDAPGMNAAIWAAAKRARSLGMSIVGVLDGYRGLLESRMEDITGRNLEDVMHQGGTFLGTARCPALMTEEGLQKAVRILRESGVEGLVVIGGDGSYRGARDLSDRGMPVIGLPGTIDNDLAYTDYTIGYDTACNNAVEEIVKIKDTMASHDRVAVIEVMGRRSGDIAMAAALAVAADYVLIPEIAYETEYDLDNLSRRLLEIKRQGRDTSIVIMSEGVCYDEKRRAEVLSDRLAASTGLDIRAIVLGHTQRGGHPSSFDSRLAVMMGVRSVELLAAGQINRAVGIRENRIIDLPIRQALETPPAFGEEMYQAVRLLIC